MVVEGVAVGGVAVVGGVVVGGGGGGGEGVVRGSGQNALQLLYPVQAVQAVVRQDVVHHLHREKERMINSFSGKRKDDQQF